VGVCVGWGVWGGGVGGGGGLGGCGGGGIGGGGWAWARGFCGHVCKGGYTREGFACGGVGVGGTYNTRCVIREGYKSNLGHPLSKNRKQT